MDEKKYTLDDIETLRSKTGVGYEEAVALLEKYDGDIARALVELEKSGKLNRDGLFSSANRGKAEDFLSRWWRAGCETRVIVERKGETLINLSALFMILALILASVLNIKDLKGKGIFRTAIFLPCCTSLVSYAIIFKTLFSYDGYVNTVLMNLGLISERVNWLSQEGSAKVIIILALIWRWTGYNMVFYLAGLQNIDDSLYEAAKIDGANAIQSFFKITVPMLKPTILLTTIMSTNGTLQLFDESVNLTGGGPANSTLTMSHYIYKASFEYNPQFGYAAAMSYVIFILVAILAFVQMKVGDKR